MQICQRLCWKKKLRMNTSTVYKLPGLQIRGHIEDNSEIVFLFLNGNIWCDPSLEPARQDGSNDGSQNMFLWRNMANYP